LIEDPVIKSWILKAEGDFSVAEHELALPPDKMVREAVCFHSQQTAEKYLKAFVASHGAPITKTHNISLLLSECSGFDPDFSVIEVGGLEFYAVDVRYPEFPAVLKIQETREAFETAKVIRNLVRDKLCITDKSVNAWKEEFTED
jgi:HEPN domain-containing protein